MEFLALGNLCVMAPSKGYLVVNDNAPTIVDNVEEMFFDALQHAGLSKRKTTNNSPLKNLAVPKTYRRKPIRPCFVKLMEKDHLEHNEKVALIYELHFCGRTDKEIFDVFHDNEAWEPAPEHCYNATETDKQLEYTLEMCKKGDYRYLKATLAELKICSVDYPLPTRPRLAYWRRTRVCSTQPYTSSRRCPANRTSPLPARNARICSRLVASESSMLMINTQHPDLPLQAHLA